MQEKSSLNRNDATLESLIAAYLRAMLAEKSYGDLARELGISKGMLSRYAAAEGSMTLATLQRIQSALGISLEDMLGKTVVRSSKRR